jgi:indolepyruvate ferredoxin oxidoreductase
MAYKDEYEVARLYADPAYLGRLREQFEGEPGRDYKLNFYLAPPLLAKRDEQGRLQKRRFGAWVLPAFRMLAGLKGLRGTAFDLFGKTAERRGERQLIVDYFSLIDEWCSTLDEDRLPVALQLANLPDEIRGFGHVKERNVQAVQKKKARLLEGYRATQRLPMAINA